MRESFPNAPQRLPIVLGQLLWVIRIASSKLRERHTQLGWKVLFQVGLKMGVGVAVDLRPFDNQRHFLDALAPDDRIIFPEFGHVLDLLVDTGHVTESRLTPVD